ncbi:hypothetical protein ACH4UT_23690 [Streptomyces sp. NPDC020799]|uniref:hypothetical protein n=1 Tax=Streptomyces sp. NPDC020799 TaxID=3365091 RepID=UPI0034918ED1
MSLGDSLASAALDTGIGSSFTLTRDRKVRLVIRGNNNTFQSFERPVGGTPDQWRATDFTGAGSGCSFDEAISAEWGQGLDHLLHLSRRA